MTSFVARDYRSGLPVQITIDEGKIASLNSVSISDSDPGVLPFVGPGLFDIQVNGYSGLWFGSEQLTVDETVQIVQALADCGIARCFPTIITSSFEAMQHGLQTLKKAVEQSDVVRRVVRGFHLEGPYISPEDGPRGAHPRQHVRKADFNEFQKWQSACDHRVRLVTVAPEAEGVIPFIRQATSSGVLVAIGHTAATAEQIAQAVDAGACLSTHLGNGCSAMLPRHSAILWNQLADDRLTASVIADGWHLPSPVLRSFLRCKTLKRLILTCDVSGFGGCAPGRYSSGDVSVDVLPDGRIAVAGQNQYLAGSGATTGDCVAHLMTSCELSLEEAWELASVRPAVMFSEPECWLQPGQEATLTLFHLRPGETGIEQDVAPAGPGFLRFQCAATIAEGRLISGALDAV